MNDFIFRTSNGTTYVFKPYSPQGQWNSVGGVYMFGRPALGRLGNWEIFYVGMTDDFQRRFSNHERWAEAVKRGTTHVLATIEKNQAARETLERELIQYLRPPMNEQHNGNRW